MQVFNTPSLSILSQKNNCDYKIRLDSFEGPLDLLLYLIKRDEVDIYDIPIARITYEYLSYIHALENLDVDIAGEFLLMAATLIHIKSHMLLPVNLVEETGNGDVEEDPRESLVRKLLEHQKYKTAAHLLWSRAEVEQAVYVHPNQEFESINGEISATVFDLLETFRKVLERKYEKVELEIARDEVTQTRKAQELRELLVRYKILNVRELFEQSTSKREMICIFLAILEMVKEMYVTFLQKQLFGDILIQLRSNS